MTPPGSADESSRGSDFLHPVHNITHEPGLGGLNQELEQALADVRLLSGLLPICAHCKTIRDTSGTWQPLETKIDGEQRGLFTHALVSALARADPGASLVELVNGPVQNELLALRTRLGLRNVPNPSGRGTRSARCPSRSWPATTETLCLGRADGKEGPEPTGATVYRLGSVTNDLTALVHAGLGRCRP